MTFNVLFNWPVGEDSARFSLGMPNAADAGHQFRVGIKEKDTPDEVKWLSPGWVNYGEIVKVDGYLKKGDQLIVERRLKETQAVNGRIVFDSANHWPAAAVDGSAVSQNFTF